MPALVDIKANLFVNDTIFYYFSMGKHHVTARIQAQLD